jgi:hypothetical protein
MVGVEDPKSEMVIRLQGSQNGQNFPVLLIHLKRAEFDAGHVRVRFPEGIDAWRSDGSHTRFYQDVRSPIWPAQLAMEPVGLPVSWTGGEKDIGFEMSFNNGMKLHSRAKVEGSSVVLSHEMRNGTETEFTQSKIWSCVQLVPSPPVSDLLMERTGVLVEGEFRFFRDLVPDFRSYAKEQAVNQRFTGYAKGNLPTGPNPRINPHPGLPDERFGVIMASVRAIRSPQQIQVLVESPGSPIRLTRRFAGPAFGAMVLVYLQYQVWLLRHIGDHQMRVLSLVRYRE